MASLGAKPVLAFSMLGAEAGGGGAGARSGRRTVAVGPALCGCRGDGACSGSQEAAQEAEHAHSLVSSPEQGSQELALYVGCSEHFLYRSWWSPCLSVCLSFFLSGRAEWW